MNARFLRWYLKVSHAAYAMRVSLVREQTILVSLWVVMKLLVLEVFLFCAALPLFFVVRNRDLEGGRKKMSRHRVFLSAALWSVLGIVVLLKVVFASFLLVGWNVETYADSNSWSFDTPSDYTYDTSLIDVSSGVAHLKDIGTTSYGGVWNTAFGTSSSSWTFVNNWVKDKNGSAVGAWQSSGGNTEGYVDNSLTVPKNKTGASYWYTPLVVSSASPDYASVSFDWKSVTFPTSPASTYKLYLFVDTTSANPTRGTQVWSSSEIAATSLWTSVAPVDIRSKISGSGTYYLKLGAYITRPNSGASSATYVSGIDNASSTWRKSTTSYSTLKPTVQPQQSLSDTAIIHWDSFTESASKDGGEIYYQLSHDNGATWEYWNGVSWTVVSLATDYMTAAAVHAHIGDFPVAEQRILWRAFLESTGTQHVALDTVSITYSKNNAPVADSVVASQTSGNVDVAYSLRDEESDTIALNTYEYSLTGLFAGEQSVMNTSTTAAAHGGTVGLSSSPAGVSHHFVWDAISQIGGTYQPAVYVRLRPHDGIVSGGYAISGPFVVDVLAPVVSNISVAQASGTKTFDISYDIFDYTIDNLQDAIEISSDNGVTWSVPVTTIAGDVGTGITSGTGQSVSWNAGVDFDEQTSSTMKIRIRAVDAHDNIHDWIESDLFSLDTTTPPGFTPIISGITPSQDIAQGVVLIPYYITDGDSQPNDLVSYEYSLTGAFAGEEATMTASTTIASHSGVSLLSTSPIGESNMFAWDARAQLGATYAPLVFVRPRSQDGAMQSDFAASMSFSVDYEAPVVSNVSASQTSGTHEVAVNYDVSDTAGGEVAMYAEISRDGGVSWTVPTTSVVGDVGSSVIFGLGKSFTWDAGIDFPNDSSDHMRVRLRAVDDKENQGSVSESDDFAVTTILAPNNAPVVGSVDGSYNSSLGVVLVSYSLFDIESDVLNLASYQYSLTGAFAGEEAAMTASTSIAGHTGIIGLASSPGGVSHAFAWDAQHDSGLVRAEHVYVRLKAHDGTSDSAYATSPSFVVDFVPVVEPPVEEKPAVRFEAAATVPQTEVVPEVVPVVVQETLHEAVPESTSEIAAVETESVVPAVSEVIQASARPEITTTIKKVLEVPVAAALTPPTIANVVPQTGGDTLVFQGVTSKPFTDVVVFLSSPIGLVYRAMSDAKGIWSYTHSQVAVELSEGVHQAYAVELDPTAGVRSAPSPVMTFEIKKNIVAQVYQAMDAYGTGFTAIVLVCAMVIVGRYSKKLVYEK